MESAEDHTLFLYEKNGKVMKNQGLHNQRMNGFLQKKLLYSWVR
jgi:hypothetical protein